MKTLQVGLGEILRKLSITISKSSQNLWFASKLQNLSIRSLITLNMLLNMLLSDDYVEVVNIVWATETPIVICFYFLQNQWSNVNIVF